jgi:phospholipid N-methyltransferase
MITFEASSVIRQENKKEYSKIIGSLPFRVIPRTKSKGSLFDFWNSLRKQNDIISLLFFAA